MIIEGLKVSLIHRYKAHNSTERTRAIKDLYAVRARTCVQKNGKDRWTAEPVDLTFQFLTR